MNKITCLLFMVLLVVSAKAQWTTGGPAGGGFNCSVQIGSGIYIGTASGLFRSLDSGLTFKHQSGIMPGNTVRFLFYDSTTLYTGFSEVSGIYISNDTGKSWTYSSGSMGPGQFYLNDRSFFKKDKKVFCSHSGGTFYTSDHGQTWKQLVLPTNLAQYILPMFCVGKTLFRQTRLSNDYFLYRSVDEGVTWTWADNGLNKKEIVNIYNIGDTIYLFNMEKILTSTDSGKTWKGMTNYPFKLPSGNTFYCQQLCYNGHRFFGSLNTGSSPGVYSIAPGDTQWVQTSGSQVGIYPSALFNQGTRVFLGGYQAMYVTNDDGDNWEKLNPGMGTLSLSVLSAEGDHVLAVSNTNLYISDNGGASWNRDPVMLAFYPFCLHYFKNVLYACDYGFGKGIFKSVDHGKNWDTTTLNKGTIYMMTDDGTNLYAGGNVGGGTSAYKSADGGMTWNYFHSGWPSGTPYDMLVKGSNVFAVVVQSSILPSVYRTGSSSANWMACTNGLPNSNSYSLAVIGNTIYTGTGNFGVFKSTDDGANWTPENMGIEMRRVYSLAVSGTDLYAGTEAGVFVLYGGSGQWTSVNYDLPVKQISKLAVNDKYLYAATYNASVWQIPLNKLAIDRVKKNPFTFEVYPNPADGELAIGNVQLAKGDKVVVMDLSGRVVESRVINEATESVKILTANLVEGIYFVQVIKDGHLLTRKFVVMH